MSITFACGHCGKVFTLDDQFAGKKGKCKQCGAVMLIPESSPEMASEDSRDFAPLRPAPLRPAPSRPAPSPRPPARPTPEPENDVYGFDEPVRPSRSNVTELKDEDFEPSPPTRFRRTSSVDFSPPRKKKSSGGGSNSAVDVVKVIGLGLVGLLILAGLAGGLTSMIPGFKTRSGLEAMLKERVDLYNGLTVVLSNVNDIPSATAASPEANNKLRGLAANLRKLKVAKGLQSDLDALKVQYGPAQEQAARGFLAQFFRVIKIPGALDALNIEASLKEVDNEEKSIPGLKQVDTTGLDAGNAPAGPQPGFNPPAPPPGFNPPAPPNMPNRGNRPGSNRRGFPQPGPGQRIGPPGN